MAGFTIVEWTTVPKGTVAYIQTIEVDFALRRRGIAAELLCRAENSAHSAGASFIWLHVDVDAVAVGASRQQAHPRGASNCRPYLERELDLLKNVKVVVALGKIAFDAYLDVLKRAAQSAAAPPFFRPQPPVHHRA